MKYIGGGLAQCMWRELSLCCAWSAVGFNSQILSLPGVCGFVGR